MTCEPGTPPRRSLLAVFFHQGAAALGEAALRTGDDLEALRAAAAAAPVPGRAAAGGHRAGHAGRAGGAPGRGAAPAAGCRPEPDRGEGARRLAVRGRAGYGAEEVQRLAGDGRSPPPASRSVRRNITVYSSDSRRSPGRLSRQGPAVLRWAVYEAGKTHARASAPDHCYYAVVKDRKDGKRAALSEARKILRQACHILAELGDDALTAA